MGVPVIVALAMAATFYVGEPVVKGVKAVDRAAVKVVKHAGKGLIHVVTFGKK